MRIHEEHTFQILIPQLKMEMLRNVWKSNKRPLFINRPHVPFCPKTINDPSQIRATHCPKFSKINKRPGSFIREVRVGIATGY